MADRGKKAKVDDEDASESFDKDLVFAIEKLQEVQDELEKVNEEASEKVLEVEQKYSEIRRPVYQKRSEIIKGITDFWLTAFLSHPALSEVLSEQDQQVLKFLQSLDVEDSKDVKSGYSITFTFRPNPYFEDNKLVKTFRFSDDGMASVIGTEPKWKDGMDFTNGEMHAVGTKRSSAEESFFKWFSEKDMSDGIQDEVADIIREDLWPNPLKYFNNDQDDDEDDDEDDDDDDEFDEEGGEDDDEGQGEEEEDDLENDEDDEDE